MKRCLLLCPIGIGNYLLCYPTFYLLHRHFPDTQFHLVVLRKSILPLANDDSTFASVTLIEPGQNKGLGNKIAWAGKLRKLKCDTAISLFPTNRIDYHAVLLASGAQRRIAFRYPSRKWRSASFLATQTVPVDESLHDVEQNLRLLPALGIPVVEPVVFPPLFDDDDRTAAKDWLRSRKLSDTPWIGLHPGSSGEHGMDRKRWPSFHFGELGKRIHDKLGHGVLVFGGSEEDPIKQEIVSTVGDGALSVEDLPLRVAAALISQCRMFVSNDSGLMHFAALSGVPTAGIFGPTDNTRTAPWGKKHLVIRKKMDCCPCWTIANVGKRENCKYGDYRCLSQLTADEVFEKITAWFPPG